MSCHPVVPMKPNVDRTKFVNHLTIVFRPKRGLDIIFMASWRGLSTKTIEPCEASNNETFETCDHRYNDNGSSPSTTKQRQQRPSKPPAKKGGHSKFIGVTWHRQDQKFQAAIKINGKSLHLGHFVDEFEAARKYDEHARRLGRKLNFSENEAAPSPSGSDGGTPKQKRAQEPRPKTGNSEKSDDYHLLSNFDPSEYFEFERADRRRRIVSNTGLCAEEGETCSTQRRTVSNSSLCADEEGTYSTHDEEPYHAEELTHEGDGVEELKVQLSAQSLRPSLLRRSSDNTIEIVRWVEAGGSDSMRTEDLNLDAPPLVLVNTQSFGLDDDSSTFDGSQYTDEGIIRF